MYSQPDNHLRTIDFGPAPARDYGDSDETRRRGGAAVVIRNERYQDPNAPPDRVHYSTLSRSQPTLPPAAASSKHLWFHGVTAGKEGDAAKIETAEGHVPDGTFFIAEVAPDSPDRPAWVLIVKFKVNQI